MITITHRGRSRIRVPGFDGFYYDVLRLPDGRARRLKVRSTVGLLPLCANTVFEPWQIERSGHCRVITRSIGTCSTCTGRDIESRTCGPAPKRSPKLRQLRRKKPTPRTKR